MIGSDLVGEPEPAALLLEVENDAAAMLLELRKRKPELIAAVAAP